MKASLKGTMGSMQDMRRKAGALLTTSKTKKEPSDSTPEEVAPVDPAKREAALRAAEERAAAAKAKSGGTMEDWRRQQRELQESRLLQMKANNHDQALSCPSTSETSVAPSADVESSVQEAQSHPSGDASQEITTPNVEARAMNEEPELLDVTEEDLAMTAEERETLMEEELQMQQALALSLESGRDVLDQERVEQACAHVESAQDEVTLEANDEDNDLRQDLGESIETLEAHEKSEGHSTPVTPSGNTELQKNVDVDACEEKPKHEETKSEVDSPTPSADTDAPSSIDPPLTEEPQLEKEEASVQQEEGCIHSKHEAALSEPEQMQN
jgi:hypothetical protein